MSKCVVHMQKMKMSAMGGIQSHNQREHESKKNREIDYERSKFNFDTINANDINYQRAIKERIAELDLKKAVRKDAVVYCSFIVSSDREFFQELGNQIHWQRCKEIDAENWWDSSYSPNHAELEYYSEEYQMDCMQTGAESFFEYATEFFKERYGEENVLNGTVHMDEATPHMHLGIIPVTKDGRLSAKTLFTPAELKSLQTDFARLVGAKYGLERGKEGSEAKHLDEVTFKLEQRTKQVEALEEQVQRLNLKKTELEQSNTDLSKSVQNAVKRIESLTDAERTLENDISVLEAKKSVLEADEQVIVNKFLEIPKIKDLFEQFKKICEEKIRRRKEKDAELHNKRQEKRESVLGSLEYYKQQIAEERAKNQGRSTFPEKSRSNKEKDER